MCGEQHPGNIICEVSVESPHALFHDYSLDDTQDTAARYRHLMEPSPDTDTDICRVNL